MGSAIPCQPLNRIDQPRSEVGIQDGAEHRPVAMCAVELPDLEQLVDVDAGKSSAVREQWGDVGDDRVTEQDVLPLAFDLGGEGSDGWRA